MHLYIPGRLCFASFLLFWIAVAIGPAQADQTWPAEPPPLPPAEGRIVRVADVAQLERALADAQPGDTIEIAEGTYRAERHLEIRTDRLTLRGAGANRDAVVLDGGGLKFGELLGLFGCRDVTVADLTLQNVRWNALKINSDHGDGVHGLTVHNCRFRNVWQRAIKSVKVRDPAQSPRDVTIRYCHFSNDRPKTFEDDFADKPGASFDGNYVGGIDAMYARNWKIHDNVFRDIRGRTGEGRAAVFLWVDSRDCLIERNLIVDCDRGIELGNAHVPPEIEVHCTAMTVRDNRITRAPVGAITLTVTRDCRVEQNRIYDPENRFRRSIRLVKENPGAVIAGNLIAGAPPRVEGPDESQITLQDNRHDLSGDDFVDAESGDLRLR